MQIADSWVDVTSVNFNIKTFYEDNIFGRQDILQFLSGEFKDYKYVKISTAITGTLTTINPRVARET